MELLAYDFYTHVSRFREVTLLANRRGNRYLVPFLIKAALYVVFRGHRFSHVHIGDGLLAPLLTLAGLFSRSSLSITIHGLDITYENALYQILIPRLVAKADTVICISRAARDECVARGIPEARCVVIPCGIHGESLRQSPLSMEDLTRGRDFSWKGRKALFSVGRLVRRKGYEWFVREVMPKLDPEYVYLIAGTGPERKNIETAISETEQTERVALLGPISEDEKLGFYRWAHLFLMPNVRVAGDMEGFGITLIEAAVHGLPSVASSIEGIRDAVLDGETGYLLEEGDAGAFAECIRSCQLRREQITERALEAFSWEQIVLRYLEVFD
jgi:phosphatidylinositol alpha-1,6-mannosyltransferase